MAGYNLHNIFCYLTNNPNFLSTIVETKENIQKKTKKKNSLMADMVTEYITLSPYDSQNYSSFPTNVKNLLTPEYMRYGIVTSMDKNLKPVNVSFLVSINILLRPDIYKNNISDHIKNLTLLENFIAHKIERNSYQIDKTKNTKKVKILNKELKNSMLDGKISPEIIQCIVNILEINLLIFDFKRDETIFYWCRGHKYPYLNLFKNIYCMAMIDNVYEPIMPPNNNISSEQQYKLYTLILENNNNIKYHNEIVLSVPALLYIDTWNISLESYNNIIEKYFMKNNHDLTTRYSEFIKYENKK